VPAQPEENVRAARRNPERRPLFDRVAQLGRYEISPLLELPRRMHKVDAAMFACTQRSC